jgi:hypothetical protein
MSVTLVTVLWICIGFNADPDPGSQIIADPDQAFESQKVEFSYVK